MIVKFDNPSNLDNDPSSFRNRDRDPPEDNSGEASAEMDEYADEFLQEDNVEDEFGNQEFSALNRQLDQLQSALDTLESRNADIHKELLELLQSNREVRRVIVEEMANEGFHSGNNAETSKSADQVPSTNSAEETNENRAVSSSGDAGVDSVASTAANLSISDERVSASDKNFTQPDRGDIESK